MTSDRHQRAFLSGKRAERIAALWLTLKGYHVLARRHKTPVGEIDLIARRGRILTFVEVKYRATREQALEAITSHQQKRIARAAAYYIGGHPRLAHLAERFDAILVTPARLPHHAVDVFRVPEGSKIW
ncbi:MAG: YraN family protein [Parvularculales bacterium]